jgi:hypothetical protein
MNVSTFIGFFIKSKTSEHRRRRKKIIKNISDMISKEFHIDGNPSNIQQKKFPLFSLSMIHFSFEKLSDGKEKRYVIIGKI